MTSTRTAALLGAGGALLLVGGPLHPQGSGATVEDYLATMLASPTWDLSHLLLLVGMAVTTAGLFTARSDRAFAPRVTALLPVVIVCWIIGTIDSVPHLFASHEHADLVAGGSTPILDTHLTLQTLATPAVGISGALLAAAVAWTERTVASIALAVVGVVGGLGFAAAGILVPLTWDPAYAVLFPLQAGLAIWLVGTAVRLFAAQKKQPATA